jgi:hypothetical protein
VTQQKLNSSNADGYIIFNFILKLLQDNIGKDKS